MKVKTACPPPTPPTVAVVSLGQCKVMIKWTKKASISPIIGMRVKIAQGSSGVSYKNAKFCPPTMHQNSR